MKLLEERIFQSGKFLPGGVIKVDSFLNHQMDIHLLEKIGSEFFKIFSGEDVTKILTIEASGIGIACLAALYFDVPVVFAKKSEAKNMSDSVYASEVHSFTRGKDFTVRVDKNYIRSDDRILVIDDFLASGKAVLGLKDIVDQAGAEIVGVGICIEKAFQPGGKMIRDMGINLHSLAIVGIDDDGNYYFKEQD